MKPDELVWGNYYLNDDGSVFRYIPFHEGQKKIWESNARFLGYISGKMAGKSSYSPIWLDNEIRKNPKGNYILCAPTNKFLDQGILPHFFKTFDAKGPSGNYLNDLHGEWNESKRLYRLPTGGIIFARSLDEPESVEAIHANAIVCDEAGRLEYSTWEILESRVAGHNGRILATTTPYKKKWLQTELIDRAKTDPNYFTVQMPSTINPYFTQEEFERQRKKMAPWKFARDFEGLITSCEGTVYPELAECVVPMPEDGLPQGRLVGSIDPGFNSRNPFAALAGVLDEDGVLWLCFEHYVYCTTDKFWSVEDHAQHLPDNVTWFCDSASPDIIRNLKRLGHYAKPVKKTAGSIESGIDLVTSRIRTGRLKIIQGTVTKLLEEADEYRYPAKDEETLGANPIGPDHALDCLRYLCLSLSRCA